MQPTPRAQRRSGDASLRRKRIPRDGRPVLRYSPVATPVGRIWVALSERGVCRVALGDPGERSFLAELGRRRPGSLPLRDDRHPAVRAAKQQILEYFSGVRSRFSLPVDLDGVTPFQRAVLENARTIPSGRVESYGRLAHAIGRPGAARAVGGALRANPVPIFVPCHRIVASDGLGGFSVTGTPGGAVSIKRRLLALEGVRARRR